MRWGHSRGFGIQSPWAYRFVRYVINERYPYYAYEELATSHRIDYRLPRLYFRLANYTRSCVWFSYSSSAERFENYIRRGCVRCSVIKILNADDLPEQVDIASVGLRGNYAQVCERIISRAHASTLLVMEGIRQHRAAFAFWSETVRDERVRVSFDLYECGLLFFDPKQYKRHYVINF